MRKKITAIQKVVEIDWSKVRQVQAFPPQEDRPGPSKRDAPWKAWEAALQKGGDK